MGRTCSTVAALLLALAMALTAGGCGNDTYDMGFREADRKVLSSQEAARRRVLKAAGWGSDVVWHPERRIEHVDTDPHWMEESGIMDIMSCSGGYMMPMPDIGYMTMPETCTTKVRYDYVLSYDVDNGAIRSFSYDGRRYM